MTKNTFLTGLLYAGMTLGLSSGLPACGPIVPLSPTWRDDVRPLVVARCVRCHDNPVHGDPTIADTGAAGADVPVTSFNEPPDVALSPMPPAGLSILGISGATYARGLGPNNRRMPPPPAAALEDWQIEMLEAWGAIKPLR